MANEKQDDRALERKREKERIRARFQSALLDPVVLAKAEKEREVREEIALQLMMDCVSDEKIRKYTKLSRMEIEYIRLNLLPKAIKDIECRNRAMNESLRR